MTGAERGLIVPTLIGPKREIEALAKTGKEDMAAQ